MKLVCKENMCAGCTACVQVCGKDAIKITDGLVHYNAVIDESRCMDCGACRKVCPNNHPTDLKEPVAWYHGWAEDDIRCRSASGGAATALIANFLERGGHVCSCVFENGAFNFRIVSKPQDAHVFAGSKYVKSDPRNVFKDVRKLLITGERVLFVGLPCQVAGLKNYVNNHKNLYTIDLVCHGSPSPVLLEMYLHELKLSLKDIDQIAFRKKNKFGIYINGKRLMPVTDAYTNAFLASIDYTENCYSCRFAASARCSDITLGDAWECSKEEKAKGISLILCQNEKGLELLKGAQLQLRNADSKSALACNHQLVHPSVWHPGRDNFFAALTRGKSFRRAAFRSMPRETAKQVAKYMLGKVFSRYR